MNEVYLLSVSVTGNGRGGNQPIITQQSFKNVLPKSFSLFFSSFAQFCFVSLLSHDPPSPPPSSFPPSLPPGKDCPPALATALGVAVVVVCWTGWTGWTGCPHVSYQVHTTATRDGPDLFVLLVSVTSQIKQFRTRLSSGLKIFTWF